MTLESKIKSIRDELRKQKIKEPHALISAMEHKDQDINFKLQAILPETHKPRKTAPKIAQDIMEQAQTAARRILDAPTHVHLYAIPAKYAANEIDEEKLAKHTTHEEVIPLPDYDVELLPSVTTFNHRDLDKPGETKPLSETFYNNIKLGTKENPLQGLLLTTSDYELPIRLKLSKKIIHEDKEHFAQHLPQAIKHALNEMKNYNFNPERKTYTIYPLYKRDEDMLKGIEDGGGIVRKEHLMHLRYSKQIIKHKL